MRLGRRDFLKSAGAFTLAAFGAVYIPAPNLDFGAPTTRLILPETPELVPLTYSNVVQTYGHPMDIFIRRLVKQGTSEFGAENVRLQHSEDGVSWTSVPFETAGDRIHLSSNVRLVRLGYPSNPVTLTAKTLVAKTPLRVPSALRPPLDHARPIDHDMRALALENYLKRGGSRESYLASGGRPEDYPDGSFPVENPAV